MTQRAIFTERAAAFLLLFLLVTCATALAAEPALELCVNPYAGVPWDRAGRYRANLHCHSTVSDGRLNPHQVVDLYHEKGYDILAITDHDSHTRSTTWPWTAFDRLEPSARAKDLMKAGKLVAEDFNYENRDPAALGMLALQGNEISRQLHCLSWFSDWHASTSDLNEQLRGVAQKGGLAAMCHPAYHWTRNAANDPVARVALTPPLRRITQGDFTLDA